MSVVVKAPPPVAKSVNTGDVLKKLDSLPTIPLVAHQVGELVNDPRVDVTKIAATLRNDQSLTAALLRLANSSYYNIPGGVSDVAHAISFLGFNTISQLAISVSVINTLNFKSDGGLTAEAFWTHSLGAAGLAEILARELQLPAPEEYFTAALLHDIGKLALIQVEPERFMAAVQVARQRGLQLRHAEDLVGLPSHDAVGARLASKWRFPMAIRVSLDHHKFAPEEARGSLPVTMRTFADVTSLANLLVRRYQFGDPGDDYIPDLDPVLLERLNLTTTRVEQMRDKLMRAAERSKVLLTLLGG